MDKRVCMYCGEILAANALSCSRCAAAAAPAPAPVVTPVQATSQDEEHLRLLVLFHYVVAGLKALMGCFPLIHLVVGIFIVSSGDSMQSPRGGPGPAVVGWFFIVIATLIILMSWTLAILVFMAGRNLSQRTRRTFCMVVGGLQCILPPFGTILGVLTIIVLSRPSVKALFR